MRTLILFLTIFFAQPSIGDTHDVSYGTIETPSDFSFKRTGTIDSFRGTLTRDSDSFEIFFDIGSMAGAHMTLSSKDKCVFYRTSKINGVFSYTGIEEIEGKTKITTTIWDFPELFRLRREGHQRFMKIPPANFWAYITDPKDLIEFMLIVSSYTSNE